MAGVTETPLSTTQSGTPVTRTEAPAESTAIVTAPQIQVTGEATLIKPLTWEAKTADTFNLPYSLGNGMKLVNYENEALKNKLTTLYTDIRNQTGLSRTFMEPNMAPFGSVWNLPYVLSALNHKNIYPAATNINGFLPTSTGIGLYPQRIQQNVSLSGTAIVSTDWIYRDNFGHLHNVQFDVRDSMLSRNGQNAFLKEMHINTALYDELCKMNTSGFQASSIAPILRK